jgi:diketogulonate reductase-like aldo/keto reductase
VALAWLLVQQALPIPKAVHKRHIDENVQAASLMLTQEDIERLNRL